MRRIIVILLMAVWVSAHQSYAADPTLETRDWPISPLAYSGQEVADGTTVTLPDGTTIAVDGGVPGSINYAALYATNGGELYLANGSLSLTNVESVGAATVDTGGYIKLDSVRIRTFATPGGRWQTGLMARTGGTIDFDQGEIVTLGNFGHGVHAVNQGTINVTNSSIEVHGNSASGAYVGVDSTVTITDSSILATSSDEGYGLYAIYSGAITMTNGTLTTEGSSASVLPAVYGRRGAAITLNSVTLATRGESGASGLLAREDDTVVTMNGGSITTVGAQSHGAFAIDGGRVVLNDVRITTTGESSHGLWVWDRSSGELNGGYLRVDGTKGSLAVLTSGAGAVTGQGVYDIAGDMLNGDDGSIDLGFDAGSVFKGGTDTGGGAIDFVMSDSVWTMDKSSTLTSLELNRGLLRFRTENSRYGSLTTRDLRGGDGTFSIRTDVGGDGGGVNNSGDLVIVTGTSDGSHHILVTDTGSGQTMGMERLTVVRTADGGARFDLVNGQVDVGAYVFGLRRVPEDTTDWELYATGGKTNPGTETPGLLTHTAYRISYRENQTLMQRMGELRASPCSPGGAWARYVGGRARTSSRQTVAGSSVRYHGMQLGIDKTIPNIPGSEVYLGIMGGFSRNDSDFRVGDATTDSFQAGAYGTLKHASGMYVDVLGRVFHMDHTLKTLTSDYTRIKGDGTSRGMSVGAEVGKRFLFAETDRRKWFVEPEGQISYSHFRSASITMNHGLKTTLRGYDSVLGRAGFLLGYSVDTSEAGSADWYVKANYLREFKGNAAYIYNDYAPSRQDYRFGRQWAEVGAGVTTRFKERHNIYADYVYAKGGGFHQHQVNLGYRLTF